MIRRNNKIWLAAAAACGFLILATVGSFVTARHMNRTADSHAMSAGRPGDASPNRINDQDKASARGPSTTGNSNVPSASR
jgi:hypothetical protein